MLGSWPIPGLTEGIFESSGFSAWWGWGHGGGGNFCIHSTSPPREESEWSSRANVRLPNDDATLSLQTLDVVFWRVMESQVSSFVLFQSPKWIKMQFQWFPPTAPPPPPAKKHTKKPNPKNTTKKPTTTTTKNPGKQGLNTPRSEHDPAKCSWPIHQSKQARKRSPARASSEVHPNAEHRGQDLQEQRSCNWQLSQWLKLSKFSAHFLQNWNATHVQPVSRNQGGKSACAKQGRGRRGAGERRGRVGWGWEREKER